MSLLSLPMDHKRTEPLPAPDAARSLLLQRATELTHEFTDEESKLSALSSPFSAFWDHGQINKIGHETDNNLQHKQKLLCQPPPRGEKKGEHLHKTSHTKVIQAKKPETIQNVFNIESILTYVAVRNSFRNLFFKFLVCSQQSMCILDNANRLLSQDTPKLNTSIIRTR